MYIPDLVLVEEMKLGIISPDGTLQPSTAMKSQLPDDLHFTRQGDSLSMAAGSSEALVYSPSTATELRSYFAAQDRCR